MFRVNVIIIKINVIKGVKYNIDPFLLFLISDKKDSK